MSKRYSIPLIIGSIVLAACVSNTPAQSDVSGTETNLVIEEAPITSLPIFTLQSIEPGEEKAYSFLSITGEELRYLIYFPEDYGETRDWPFIYFLHGGGGVGDSIDALRGKTIMSLFKPRMEFPFIVVSPQIPFGAWPYYIGQLNELLDSLTHLLPINGEALFLTGYSLGGHGSWHYGMAEPTRFAAVVPVAGGPIYRIDDPLPAGLCDLKETPVWVFHGDADKIIPMGVNVAAVQALKDCGSNSVSFTIYKGQDHGAATWITYSDPALYEWMLEQVR